MVRFRHHAQLLRESAVASYIIYRQAPAPSGLIDDMPRDGHSEWVKETNCSKEDLGGDEPREFYWRVKYTEGPGDRAWMQEKDRNYLTMLAEEAVALLPPSNKPQPRDPTGLIAATRELHSTLAEKIAEYDFDTYENIEQQLLDAKARLPAILAASQEMAADPDGGAAAAAAASMPLVSEADLTKNNLSLVPVPANPNSALLTVSLGYLLPVLNNPAVFQTRFIALFGQISSRDLDPYKRLLKSYDGSVAFFQDPKTALIPTLLNRFRARLCTHMQAQRSTFLPNFENEAAFDTRLASLKDPQTWIEREELDVIAQLLKVQIHTLEQFSDGQWHGELPKADPTMQAIILGYDTRDNPAQKCFHLFCNSRWIPMSAHAADAAPDATPIDIDALFITDSSHVNALTTLLRQQYQQQLTILLMPGEKQRDVCVGDVVVDLQLSQPSQDAPDDTQYDEDIFDDMTIYDRQEFLEPRLAKDRSSVSLEHLFDNPDDTTVNRILIEGAAGVGKSTLCKDIARRWSTGQFYNDRFKVLLYFPLKKMLQHYDKTTTDGTAIKYNLTTMLSQAWDKIGLYQSEDEFGDLQTVDNDQKAALIDYVKQHKNNVLFILDGLDEVDASHPLTTALLQYLPSYIITLRSQKHLATNMHLRGFFDDPKKHFRVIQCQGFNAEKRPLYIQRYFDRVSQIPTIDSSPIAGRKAMLLDWLDKNPNLHGLCSIPLLLQLLCSYCVNAKDVTLQDGMTMTLLYKRLFDQWKKLALESDLDPSKLKSQTFSKSHSHADLFQAAFMILQRVSFESLRSQQQTSVLISGDLLEKSIHAFLNEHDVLAEGIADKKLELQQATDDLHHAILATGILRGTDHYAKTFAQSYDFIHLTFIEYLAAEYLSTAFQQEQDSSAYQLATNTLATYQYHPRFEVVWWFMAGLLTTADRQSALLDYFQQLMSHEDLSGVHQLPLLLRCFNESVCSSMLGDDFKTSLLCQLEQSLLHLTHRTDEMTLSDRDRQAYHLQQYLSSLSMSPWVMQAAQKTGLIDRVMKAVFAQTQSGDEHILADLQQLLSNALIPKLPGTEFDDFMQTLMAQDAFHNQHAAHLASSAFQSALARDHIPEKENTQMAQLGLRLLGDEDEALRQPVIAAIKQLSPERQGSLTIQMAAALSSSQAIVCTRYSPSQALMQLSLLCPGLALELPDDTAAESQMLPELSVIRSSLSSDDDFKCAEGAGQLFLWLQGTIARVQKGATEPDASVDYASLLKDIIPLLNRSQIDIRRPALQALQLLLSHQPDLDYAKHTATFCGLFSLYEAGDRPDNEALQVLHAFFIDWVQALDSETLVTLFTSLNDAMKDLHAIGLKHAMGIIRDLLLRLSPQDRLALIPPLFIHFDRDHPELHRMVQACFSIMLSDCDQNDLHDFLTTVTPFKASLSPAHRAELATTLGALSRYYEDAQALLNTLYELMENKTAPNKPVREAVASALQTFVMHTSEGIDWKQFKDKIKALIQDTDADVCKAALETLSYCIRHQASWAQEFTADIYDSVFKARDPSIQESAIPVYGQWIRVVLDIDLKSASENVLKLLGDTSSDQAALIELFTGLMQRYQYEKKVPIALCQPLLDLLSSTSTGIKTRAIHVLRVYIQAYPDAASDLNQLFTHLCPVLCDDGESAAQAAAAQVLTQLLHKYPPKDLEKLIEGLFEKSIQSYQAYQASLAKPSIDISRYNPNSAAADAAAANAGIEEETFFAPTLTLVETDRLLSALASRASEKLAEQLTRLRDACPGLFDIYSEGAAIQSVLNVIRNTYPYFASDERNTLRDQFCQHHQVIDMKGSPQLGLDATSQCYLELLLYDAFSPSLSSDASTTLSLQDCLRALCYRDEWFLVLDHPSRIAAPQSGGAAAAAAAAYATQPAQLRIGHRIDVAHPLVDADPTLINLLRSYYATKQPLSHDAHMAYLRDSIRFTTRQGSNFSDKHTKAAATDAIDAKIERCFQVALDSLKKADLGSTSPSLFIVYAHDNPTRYPEYSADAAMVRQLIHWMDQDLQLDLYSDKNALGRGRLAAAKPTETPTSADRSTNILKNQICLLPGNDLSVNWVILCGSALLGHLSQSEMYAVYDERLNSILQTAKLNDSGALYKQLGVGLALSAPKQKEAVHHVLTELNFIHHRLSQEDHKSSVVPVLLNGDRQTSLPKYYTDDFDVRIGMAHPDPAYQTRGLGLRFGFFELLRRIFNDQKENLDTIKAVENTFKSNIEKILEDDSAASAAAESSLASGPRLFASQPSSKNSSDDEPQKQPASQTKQSSPR